MLEKVRSVFNDSNYEIVKDAVLSKTVPARCFVNNLGGLIIQIKESIYLGGYDKHIGAYLGFICHEICHVFLYKIGYVPLLERNFKQGELCPYESVEWQTKALAGEVMMPYEETKNLSVKQIIDNYCVSKGFAEKSKKY